MKRIFTRRGKTENIYSDNGTNFVGAKNEIFDLYKLLTSKAYNDKMSHWLADESINWHFSPHFGGLWEISVKLYKHHLYRTVGDTVFTFE